ncbi:MAG TPA: iron chelate uptake ABC transporter family permease subunit, partial [Methanomassiliicoccales archaeon]|nr:iron chelate uptake ABC transporter family permease subunit [Methanomassiliicoccales archaeon]
MTPDIEKLHRDKLALWSLVLILLAVGLFISMIFSICIGAVNIPASKVLEIITGLYNGPQDSDYMIVVNVRLPRVLMAAVVGAGLSVAGVAMQGVFRNPMASPSVLGISSGAAFGASLAIVLGFSFVSGAWAIPAMAFVFCIGTMFLVYGLSRTGGIVPVETLLLAGIAVGALFSALVSFMQFIAGEQLSSVVFWLMGGLSSSTWQQLYVITPLIAIGSFAIAWFARDLNLMTIGEEHASSLGVDTQKLILYLTIATSVVVAAAVSVSGVIGFVGLIIPHIIRLMVGPD